MAENKIFGTTANPYIAACIHWTSVAHPESCASTVTARLLLRRTNQYTGTATGGVGSFTLELGQTLFPVSGKALTIPNDGSWVLAMEVTTQIPHESDGTKILSLSASGSLPPSSVKWIQCQGQAQLDAIPRGSRIAEFSCDTGCLDGVLTARIAPLREGLFHSLRLRCEQLLQQTDPEGTEAAFQLQLPDREALYLAHTDTKTVTLQLELDTYEDAQRTRQLGQTVTAELTLAMPEAEVRPTLEVTAMPLWQAGTAQLQTLYVQDHSQLQVTVRPQARYGATTEQVQLTVNGTEVTLTQGVYCSHVLTAAGTLQLKSSCTDSRGLTAGWEETVTVLPYAEPQLTVGLCSRWGAQAQSDEGTYLYVDAQLTHTALPVQEEDANPCSLLLRSKPVGAQAYGPELLLCRQDRYQDIAQAAGVAVQIAVDKSYQVQLIARDQVGQAAVTTFLIPTAKVHCHEGNGFLALGKYAEAEQTGVDIAADWPVRIRGAAYLEGGLQLWRQEAWVSLEDYIKQIINGG